MHDPDLLILDEPTAGVAPNLIEDILEWEVEAKTKRDLGVLITKLGFAHSYTDVTGRESVISRHHLLFDRFPWGSKPAQIRRFPAN